MSCTNLENILKDCGNPIGGIKRIYINDMENIVTEVPTLSAWTVSVSAQTVFSTVEFRKNLGTYTEDYTREDDGAIVYTPNITIPLHGREAAKSRKINILAEGQRELAIIVEMNSGKFVYFTNMQLSSVADGSGAARTEASKYTVTFDGEMDHLAYFINSADIPALVTP
jgi:hypothetical protein